MRKLDARDLFLIRDSAIQHYIDIPARSRLPGMTRDLTEDEKRSLSYLEACVECLSRLGAVKQEVIEEALPQLFQHTYLADHIEDI